MPVQNACKIPVLAVTLALLCGCAPQNPQNSQYRSAPRASLQCPTGHTMTCEATSIGRIRHGSFARNSDRCACVPDDGPVLQSPVIPSMH